MRLAKGLRTVAVKGTNVTSIFFFGVTGFADIY